MSHADPIVSGDSADPGILAGSATGNLQVSSTKIIFAFVALGLVAGLLGGMAVNQTHALFPVIEPEELKNTQGIYTPEQRALAYAAHLTADLKNLPTAIGLLGLIVAGTLGLAGFVVKRSSGSAVSGALTGAVAGAVLGAAAGALAIVVYQQLTGLNLLGADGQPDPLKTQAHAMAIHLPSWISIAIAASLAVAISWGKSLRNIGPTLTAAAGAVILAAVLYPTIAAVIFTGEDPGRIIPTGHFNQILWTVLNSVLLGLMLGRQRAHAIAAEQKSGT